MALFQYQALAEPTSVTSAPPETIQADKWYVVPTPPPRPPQRAANLSTYAVDPSQLTLAQVVKLDMWYRQPVELTPLARRLTDREGLDLCSPEPSKTFPWVYQFPAPIQLKRLVDRDCFDYGGIVTAAPTINVDRWAHFYPDYLRPLPRLPDRESCDFIEFDESKALGWLQFPIPPLPLRRLTDRDCYDYGAGSFAETVTADRWCHFFPDYLRPVPRLTDRDGLDFGEGVYTAESVTVDRWNPAQGDPTRNRSRTWLGGFSTTLGVFNAEATTADRWAHFFPDYLRPTPRITDREALDFGAGVFNVESVTVDRWAKFYQDYLRPLARITDREALDYGEGVFVVERVTADRWVQPQSVPTRPLPRTDRVATLPTFQAAIGAFNPATGFPYPTPESPPRPVRRELSADGWACTTLGVFTAETVRLDKWYAGAQYPPRPRQRLMPVSAAETLLVTPLADRWSVLPEAPIRKSKGAPFDATVYGFATTVDLDRWFVGASAPPRANRRSTAEPAASILITSPAITVDRWVGSHEPPPRPVSRTAFLQPAFFAPVLLFSIPPGWAVAMVLYVGGASDLWTDSPGAVSAYTVLPGASGSQTYSAGAREGTKHGPGATRGET